MQQNKIVVCRIEPTHPPTEKRSVVTPEGEGDLCSCVGYGRCDLRTPVEQASGRVSSEGRSYYSAPPLLTSRAGGAMSDRRESLRKCIERHASSAQREAQVRENAVDETMEWTTTDQRRWGRQSKALPSLLPTRPARTRRRSQSNI